MAEEHRDTGTAGAVVPRFFVRHRAAGWILLVASLAWGAWSYRALPRHRDPAIVVPVAGVLCAWPGHRAAEVEREVTVPIERALAADRRVRGLESSTADHLVRLRVELDESVEHPAAVFAELAGRLRELPGLPPGAGPPRLLHGADEAVALLLAVVPELDGAGRPAHDLATLAGFATTVVRELARSPAVTAVRTVGRPEERLFVDLDLDRLRASGLAPADLLDTLDLTAPPDPDDPDDPVDPLDPARDPVRDPARDPVRDPVPGRVFASPEAVAAAPLGVTLAGPVELGTVARLHRGAEEPARAPVFWTERDASGTWRRAPALVLEVERAAAFDFDRFGASVDRALAAARGALPQGVRIVRLSDQGAEAAASQAVFGRSLLEAIGLVVLVGLVGFRNLRAAALLALSIPLTLALTFGLLALLGIDLQQVSTAALVLALGLLVDDPVVASDAIAVEIAAGRTPREAAWRGPARLSRAIFFATATNIVAYLPLLLLRGNVGRFLLALPIVLTCALVASRLVSMSFVPLAGAALLRATPRGPDARFWAQHERVRRTRRAGAWALAHRGALLAGATALLVPGWFLARGLPTQFFPRDLTRLALVDLWLPADADAASADATAARAEAILGEVGGRDLHAVATFVGRGAPRFWVALEPAPPRADYAQLLLVGADADAIERLAEPAQAALAARLDGALDADWGQRPGEPTPVAPAGWLDGTRADVRQLEIGQPVGVPVQVRLSGEDPAALRAAAERVVRLFSGLPEARRVRTSWPALFENGTSGAPADLGDLRLSAARAMGGLPFGVLRDGARTVPVLLRVAPADLGRLARELATAATEIVPAGASLATIERRDQRRSVTVACFPAPGRLASQTLAAARPELERLRAALPAGVRLELGGEAEAQSKAFGELAVAFAISLAAIYLALALELRSLLEPLVVFAALPFAALGALAALRVLGQPFGFMAFLGLASLAGVVVSHVIVLCDGIAEARRAGLPLERALVEASLARLRPVLITVAATILALLPLAYRGGPLWLPLCVAQIGGLGLATAVTLIVVPLLYAVGVRDLHLLRWPE